MTTTTTGHSDDSEEATTEALRQEFAKGGDGPRFGPYLMGAGFVFVALFGLFLVSRAEDRALSVPGLILFLGGLGALWWQVYKATDYH